MLIINKQGAIMSSEIKKLNMNIPKETWVFLKTLSIEQEISVTHVVLNCIKKYRENLEKKLDNDM